MGYQLDVLKDEAIIIIRTMGKVCMNDSLQYIKEGMAVARQNNIHKSKGSFYLQKQKSYKSKIGCKNIVTAY